MEVVDVSVVVEVLRVVEVSVVVEVLEVLVV